MLYRCEHCNYTTKRLSDLRRHEGRQFPCYIKFKLDICNLVDDLNVHVGDRNVGVGDRNVGVDYLNVHFGDKNVGVNNNKKMLSFYVVRNVIKN